jgi:KDO2-lipid IV(A) lauroyltransferase
MTEEPARTEHLRKRKAWTYESPVAPPFADFRAGGERRRLFLKYWLHDNIDNVFDIAMFFALKLLPARDCSNLGAFLGRFSVPRWHKAQQSRAKENLKALRPDATEAQIEALLLAYAESQGRQMTEYSVVDRLARNACGIRFHGTERFAERCEQRPVILIAAHISNWEVLTHCLVNLGLVVTLNYDPPKRRARHWIVNRVRKGGGLRLLKPGRHSVRPALRVLEENGNLLIFCDEGFNGRMRAPFFGNPPHLEGNYALIARMARKTDALIYPVYLERDHGVNFSFHALEPFKLPPEEKPGDRLVDDVLLLNSVIEPIVRSHAAQWYFIDNRMPDRHKS